MEDLFPVSYRAPFGPSSRTTGARRPDGIHRMRESMPEGIPESRAPARREPTRLPRWLPSETVGERRRELREPLPEEMERLQPQGVPSHLVPDLAYQYRISIQIGEGDLSLLGIDSPSIRTI